MIFINKDTNQFGRVTVQELRDALDDPRLPVSFLVQPVTTYPALAIVTDDDSAWYIGYIDLCDGTYHLRKPGQHDGINPHVDMSPLYVHDLDPLDITFTAAETQTFLLGDTGL